MCHKMEGQVQQEDGAEEVRPELRHVRQVHRHGQEVPQVEEQVFEEQEGTSKMPADLWSVLQQRLPMMGLWDARNTTRSVAVC
mmetsp:Transcript_134186/g.267783  ORF Transcript_134186/g.267783 Transcript_134186/m.267783 type:complete len:83 (+) Transcript_134186:244-492(+)